jgi:hypothetical protein
VGFWLLAASLASLAVWWAPAPAERPAEPPAGDLVFFEFTDEAGVLLDAGGIDGSPGDAAP